MINRQSKELYVLVSTWKTDIYQIKYNNCLFESPQWPRENDFIIIQHLLTRRSDVGHMLSSVRRKLIQHFRGICFSLEPDFLSHDANIRLTFLHLKSVVLSSNFAIISCWKLQGPDLFCFFGVKIFLKIFGDRI